MWPAPPGMPCGDVSEWHRLHGRCPRCGHIGELPLAAQRRAAKMAGHMQLVARKLRCTRCRSADCQLLIEELDRNV
jgi:hypothetical protein